MKKYESILKRNLVCSDDGFQCFESCYTIDDCSGRSAILVTLYPSYSGLDIHKLDNTAVFIYNHMEELGLRQIRIINLFSRIVRGSKMSTRGIQLDKENLQYIENNIMKQKDFSDNIFILGWGSSLASSLVANQTKDKIIELFSKYNPKGTIYQLCAGNSSASDSLLHPLFLGIRFANARWTLAPYTPPESFVSSHTEKTHKKNGKVNIHRKSKTKRATKNDWRNSENTEPNSDSEE